jgi:methylglutaconyl-CoA hydratase
VTNKYDSGSTPSVLSTCENAVCSISFFHPKGNSLPSELLRRLAEEIAAAGDDEKVRVVVLRSEGTGSFCGGASFDELRALSTVEAARDFFLGFAHVILAIVRCPKLTIARVHGKVVGGGVGLVAACDYSVGVVGADARLSELDLGIGPFVIGPCVTRRIGVSRFSTMATGTAWHSAQWCFDGGLYSAIVPDVAHLDTEVGVLASKLATRSSDAMKELKGMLWKDASEWNSLLPAQAEITARLLLSDHCRQILAQQQR